MKGQPGQQQSEPTSEALDRDTESVVDRFVQGVEPRAVLGAIQDIAKGGDISRSSIEAAASQLGIEPGEVEQMAGQLRQAFEGQARASVNQSGLDPDAVFGWAWENHPEKMRDAIHKHATERTTKGYQSIVTDYLVKLPDTNPDAILSAQLGNGIEVKQGRDGRLYLRTPAGEMEWRSALRSGLIKVSRAR